MFRVIINYKNYFSQQLLSYIHVCHLSVCRSVYRNIFARGLKNAGRRPRDIFETDGKVTSSFSFCRFKTAKTV